MRARMAAVAVVAIGALFTLVAFNATQDWALYQNVRDDTAISDLGHLQTYPLYSGVRAERKATAVYLANPTGDARQAMRQQRGAADTGLLSFQELADSDMPSEHPDKWAAARQVNQHLDRLGEIRRQVDSGQGDADEIIDYYTGALNRLVEFYQTLALQDDLDLTLGSRAEVGLFWTSESQGMEDLLIAQAVAAGRMTAEQRVAFAEAYGSQREIHKRMIDPNLSPDEQALYRQVTSSEAWQTLERVERAVLNAPAGPEGTIEDLPSELKQWDDAFEQVSFEMGGVLLARAGAMQDASDARADELKTHVWWQVGGSLAAILVIAVLIIGVIRSITRQLRTLTASAEYSAQRLPEVVRLLQDGEEVDVDAEFAQPVEGRVEFARVHRALASSQHTAMSIAAAQAADRRGFTGFVAVTSGRALNLVEVQLRLLDVLERKHGKNADLLSDLIGVDQKAVSARQHLDNLMTLAGAEKQLYSSPKPLADLVHDAAAETQHPRRVVNRVTAEVLVRPEAVNGLIHLIAALLDNALQFSSDEVRVVSRKPIHGTAIEIEDMGTGMTEEQYEVANAMLADPPTFGTVARQHHGRLGLFVVSHLARRHGLRVQLRPSDYGGTTAVVLIPFDLHLSPKEVLPPVQEPEAIPAAPRRNPVLPRRPLRAQLTGVAEDTAQDAPRPATPSDAHADTDTSAGSAAEARAGADAPGANDAGSGAEPKLPRRRPGSHMAPVLASGAPQAPDAYDPATDDTADQVGVSWAAFQEGVRAAETHSASAQEDPIR